MEKCTQWKASLDRLCEHITHKTAPLFYEGLSVDAELRVKEQQQEKTYEIGPTGKFLQSRPSQENRRYIRHFSREVLMYGIGSPGVRELKNPGDNIVVTLKE